MIHKMLLGAFLAISPMLANAAGLNGAELSIAWAIPFAGILLSIALCPMLVPHFWHNHFGKVAVAWALLCAAFCGLWGHDCHRSHRARHYR